MAEWSEKLESEEQGVVTCMFFGEFILDHYEAKIDGAKLAGEIAALLRSEETHPWWKRRVLDWVVGVFSKVPAGEREELAGLFHDLVKSEVEAPAVRGSALRAEYWFVVRQYRGFARIPGLKTLAEFPTGDVVRQLMANEKAEKVRDELGRLLLQVGKYQESVRVFLLSSSLRANDKFWISTILDRKEWVEELRSHFRQVAASEEPGVDLRLGALSILVEHFRENQGPALERLLKGEKLTREQTAIAESLSRRSRTLGSAARNDGQ